MLDVRPKAAITNWTKRNVGTFIVIAAIAIVWQLYWELANPLGNLYFPSIAFSIDQTVSNSDIIIEATRITFTEVFAGFAFGVFVGVAIGILYSESFLLRQASLPMLVFIYSLPFAIIAPIFIVWFGTGVAAVAAFVGLFSFYPVFINTITGFTHVDEEFYYLGEVCGATRWQMIKEIKWWAAFPHVVSGIKIAVQQSVVGAIVAEFIASGGGLGNEIIVAAQTQQIGLMFGILFLIMVIAVVYFKLVSWFIDNATPGPAHSA
jgi:NitT/TauT family transport system permease protein